MLRSAPLHCVVGTAGHVDHGKSSLVQALTGTDPDRLPEEKRRGMTIELGFAFLRGTGLDIAFIDCPGHERFVHHMVAGAGSMEGCLLIVAANEGPCAQTREHLDILRLLGLRWGRVVLTKCDLVDDDGLALAHAAVTELVAGTVFAAVPPIAVSAHRGDGLPELRDWLFAHAVEERRRASGVHVRLPVDRVFTVAGHGTVVTGTLIDGTISVGDALELHPGGAVRVRSLQVNHLAVDQALAGQRTAVNLAGIDRAQVGRGAWLATSGSLQPSRCIDIAIEVLPIGLKHRAEVEVYHGTGSVTGRVHLLHADHVEGGSHDAQLRLDDALHVRPGDRLVLRRPSPPANLAGAVVVDPSPPHHKRFSEAARSWFGARRGGVGAEGLIAWLGDRAEPPSETEALAWAGGRQPLDDAIAAAGSQVRWRLVGAQRRLWSMPAWQRLGAAIDGWLRQAAIRDPTRCWFRHEDVHAAVAPSLGAPLWDDALDDLADEFGWVRREARICQPAAVPELPARLLPAARALLVVYDAAGLEPPYDHPCWAAQPDPALAQAAHQALTERGWLVRLNDRQHLHRRHAEALVAGARAALDAGRLDVQALKTRFNLPRKYAIPYLEWLDAQGITRRQGDGRLPGPHRQLPIPALGAAPA